MSVLLGSGTGSPFRSWRLWKENIDHTAAESLQCCLQIVSFLSCQPVAIATRGYLEPSPLPTPVPGIWHCAIPDVDVRGGNYREHGYLTFRSKCD